jgi:hypothetical protein
MVVMELVVVVDFHHWLVYNFFVLVFYLLTIIFKKKAPVETGALTKTNCSEKKFTLILKQVKGELFFRYVVITLALKFI